MSVKTHGERFTDSINLRTTAEQRAFLEALGWDRRLSLGGAVRCLIDEAMQRSGKAMG